MRSTSSLVAMLPLLFLFAISIFAETASGLFAHAKPRLLPNSYFSQQDRKELNAMMEANAKGKECKCHDGYMCCKGLSFCWEGCKKFVLKEKESEIPNY